MEAWQQRVKDEKSLLDASIDRLTKWLRERTAQNVDGLELMDIALMEAQLMSMLTYSSLLGLRIARFK